MVSLPAYWPWSAPNRINIEAVCTSIHDIPLYPPPPARAGSLARLCADKKRPRTLAKSRVLHFQDSRGLDVHEHGVERIAHEMAALIAPLLSDAIARDFPKGLRVATVCSGTDSPILALSLANDSRKAAGLQEIPYSHVFSCEIDPAKQVCLTDCSATRRSDVSSRTSDPADWSHRQRRPRTPRPPSH